MNSFKITPYKRVMMALTGEEVDKIPFTIYDTLINRSSIERNLRNRGLCLIKCTCSYKIIYPNVNITSFHYTDQNNHDLIETEYTTPKGNLHVLQSLGGSSNWTIKHMFKTVDDYKALLFLFKDAKIVPQYETLTKTIDELGEDYVVRDQIGLEPMQMLISSLYMNVETFCMEWMENRDQILILYNELKELNRKIYQVVADGPLQLSNYGGNVVPQIIGKEIFEKYYIPNYNEAAEVLHNKGKLIGVHFDADNTLIMDQIGRTDLDYIEAYDAGISPPVKEARKKWPNKVLWLNWPSSWHLENQEEVCLRTINLIKEASASNKFIIGITEDVPIDLQKRNYSAIMDGIEMMNATKSFA